HLDPRRPGRPASVLTSDLLALADHDHAAGGHLEAFAVGVEVDADGGALRDADILVDDGVAYGRVPAHVHVVHEHRPLDGGVGVHRDGGGGGGLAHRTAGDHHSGADHRVERVADPLALL